MNKVLDFNVPKKIDEIRTGKVKWWNDVRRMGFIISDGEEFLITDKDSVDLKNLREGVAVKFVPYESIRGLEARDIEII